MGSFKTVVPDKVANMSSHNQTTTNHTKIIIQVNRFVSLRYDHILNALHELQVHEEVESEHVLYHWYQSRLQLGTHNRKVPTLIPSIDEMKAKVE